MTIGIISMFLLMESSAVSALTIKDDLVLKTQSAEWTVMVYLDADNDLEEVGTDDFLEMAAAGSTENKYY